MPSIFVHARRGEQPKATVGETQSGLFISFQVGDLTIYVPGDNHEAVENAQAWASSLVNAAQVIAAQLPQPVAEGV